MDLWGEDLENRAAHPHQEFPGIFPPPWGLKSERKETKTLCSSRCAILSSNRLLASASLLFLIVAYSTQ